jgi:glycine/D-amino acid oxidase-like deaminating enzyme
VTDVVILEKDHVGWGATGKSSAIIRQHYSQEVTARMALEGLRFFQNFEQEFGERDLFVNTGFLALASAGQEAAFRRNVETQKRAGVNVRLLDQDELKRLEPEMEVAETLASYEPEAGYADSVRSTQIVAEKARSLGVTVLTRTAVTGLHAASGRIQSLSTQVGEIEASRVLCATNIWTNQVLNHIGLQIPMEPTRSQLAIFQRPPEFSRTHTIVIDLQHNLYWRPVGADRTMVGTIDPHEEQPNVDPDTYKQSADEDIILAYAERLVRRYPVMAKATLYGNYCGAYDVTPDWHPVMDLVPNFENLYFVVGLSGHGFKLAPAMGRMMADFLTTGKKTPDLEFFRFSRFEDGEPIGSEYGPGVVA